MEREGIEAAIRKAFAGVRLGSGISLRQAQAFDNYLEGLTQADFEALPRSEVTDDWTQVSEEELRRDCVAHLDSEGLRYYLPALMLWLLDNYDPTEERLYDGDADMTVIGTIMALTGSKEYRDRLAQTYSNFSPEQKAAIALYLEALPRLVDLDDDDTKVVARSLHRYWRRFLSGSR